MKMGRSTSPIVTVSPTVRTVLEILLEQGLTYREISKRAGIGLNAPTRWRHGINSPSIITVENTLEVLGYEIIIVKKRKD